MRTPSRLRRAAAALAILLCAEASAAALPVKRSGGRVLSVEEAGSFTAPSIQASIPRFFEMYPAPRAKYPVRKYAIRFSSLDFDGSPVTVRAQVFVPVLGPDEAERPLYVFASGTTGIGDRCAPSLETPETKRWGWYEQNMLAYATLGFIVVFPDYTGFNDPDRPQRYFSKYAEGYMMLDAIRAGLALFPMDGLKARPSGAVFTAGYSQGGHAAMAAADLHGLYAPEAPLTGMVTYGSTNDVEALVREGPAYAPLILYSYMSMYGGDQVDPADFLQERWLPTFEADASYLAVDEFQVYYGFDHASLYAPAFDEALYGGRLAEYAPDLHRLLEANDTGLSGHGLPALVVQGAADFIVTTASQTLFVERLRDRGSAVELMVAPKASHRYTRMAGFARSVEWMTERALSATKIKSTLYRGF